MIDISLLWNHSPSEWFSMHKNAGRPALHGASGALPYVVGVRISGGRVYTSKPKKRTVLL